jgi:hypothetical protein
MIERLPDAVFLSVVEAFSPPRNQHLKVVRTASSGTMLFMKHCF